MHAIFVSLFSAALSVLSLQGFTQGKHPAQLMLDRAWSLINVAPDSSLFYARQASIMAKHTQDDRALSVGLNIIGIYHKNRGSIDSAAHYFHQSLHIRERLGDPLDLARSYINLGNLYRKEGQFQRSAVYYEKAVAALHDLDEPAELAKVENALGLALLEMGMFSPALNHIKLSLELREQLGDTSGVANCHTSMGNYYETVGLFPEAFEWYQKAHVLYQQISDPSGQAKTLNNLGNVAQLLHNFDLAEKFYRESLKINETLGFQPEMADTWTNLGVLYETLRETDKAVGYFRKALAIHQSLGDHFGISNGYAHLGHLYSLQNEPKKSIDTLLLAYAMADSLGALLLLLNIAYDLSNAYADLGDFSTAHQYNQRIHVISDRLLESKNEAFLHDLDGLGIRVEKSEQEKLEALLALEEEKSQRQTQLLYAALGVLVLLALLFYSRLRNYRQKIRIAEAEHRASVHQNELELERKQKELQQNEMEKKLQAQKIATMDALLEGQLKERMRIAQELHDRLGSVLSVLKIHLAEMVQEIMEGLQMIHTKGEDRLGKVNQLIDTASETVREISSNLRAGTLDQFGLVPAIEELCSRLHETGKMEVELHCGSLKNPLPADIEWSAYQIVEEALNNVLKHAQASRVIVQLFRGPGRFSVSVEDNGVGFNTASPRPLGEASSTSRMGLNGMKWRADKVGATFSLDSEPGHGTTIMIEYKLTDHKNNDNGHPGFNK